MIVWRYLHVKVGHRQAFISGLSSESSKKPSRISVLEGFFLGLNLTKPTVGVSDHSRYPKGTSRRSRGIAHSCLTSFVVPRNSAAANDVTRDFDEPTLKGIAPTLPQCSLGVLIRLKVHYLNSSCSKKNLFLY